MKKLLLAAAMLMVAIDSSHATEDFCAVVKHTDDGFLALRAEPTTQSEIVFKLHQGDYVIADTLGATDHKGWTHVNSVLRRDGPSDASKKYAHYTHGWVASRYVESFVCPEDQAEEGKR